MSYRTSATEPKPKIGLWERLKNWIDLYVVNAPVLFFLGVTIFASCVYLLFDRHYAIENQEFLPANCIIYVSGDQYKIVANGQNPEQSQRVIVIASDLRQAEGLAFDLGCQRLKSTTGGWRAITR
jgi:hypothetical protein